MGFEYAKLYWGLLVLGSIRCLLWGLMEDTKKTMRSLFGRLMNSRGG